MGTEPERPLRRMAFAVPGDINTTTGGYLYDRRLAQALEARGIEVRHLRFGDSFPQPTPIDMQDAVKQLQALPSDCPALVDGLAYGALETSGLCDLRAPLVALVHHPLALEPGLSAVQARDMAARETANLALAQQIVVTSGHIAGLLRDAYGVPPHRVHIARPGFMRPLAAVHERDSPPLILSVGIVAQRKGHDVLLQALAQIVDLEWRAVIVGRAHEPDTVRALHMQRTDLGLSTRVEIAGEISQSALDGLYARATLFALATRYEGYGIVFDEAMGHGLPIVSTDVGAVPDTVAPGAGVLVPPEDPAAFASALRRVLEDAGFQAGCALEARRAASHLGDWNAAARVVEGVLFEPSNLG
ncbi:glycosyltransferase family 4 protein [uncultured Roseovarius sp.]|uniref:glycosyltransferase family 4 protein n=1 Tax=uncultured Roseovarius sp. TaxID=293344 RepID=UPI00260CF8DB|nr:glycosyltransferase family 4 protein [uncultured Roseovarius sp.]